MTLGTTECTLLGMTSSTTGSMGRAVAVALRTVDSRPEDAGAIALCRRYARLIDHAAPNAKYRKALQTLAIAASESEDEKASEAFHTVADALAEHSVASDLGPKLLAALTSLGLTLAGRGAKGGQSDAKPGSRLDELRERRARKGRAADMDTAAP